MPVVTYSLAGTRPDPPRLELQVSNDRRRLSPFDGGRPAATPVTVQGHLGLLESGAPTPQFTGVRWKPGRTYLLSVVGYKLPGSVVLRVARHVSFGPPGVISLPVAAGRIITRQEAVAIAGRATHLSVSHATTKLSSWTEVNALRQAAGGRGDGVLKVPGTVSSAPWRTVWAVRLTGRIGATGSAPQPSLVVIAAASGRAEVTARAGDPAWFAALTDRDPAVKHRCPGGSRARLPFGVLTRDEEAYTVAKPSAASTGQARTSVVLKLTTVRAVNKADPNLYGGCVEQNCSLDELVWVTVETVRAEPGKTVACLPGSVSVPAGYHPKQVQQYFVIRVPGNLGIGCSGVPSPIRRLTDLAPPSK